VAAINVAATLIPIDSPTISVNSFKSVSAAIQDLGSRQKRTRSKCNDAVQKGSNFHRPP
jgi:hypothetical protein